MSAISIKSLLASVAVACGSTLYLSAPSLAADAVVEAPPEPPEAPDDASVPGRSWTGPYIGGDFGYHHPGSNENGPGDGLLGGVHAGYNFEVGGFVIGPEIDVNYNQGVEHYSIYGESMDFAARWQGSVRARVGVPLDDDWMVYGTAGVAFAQGELSGQTFSDKQTHIGWTVGAGVEHFFTDHVLGRFEVRYTDFGSQTYTTPSGPADLDMNQIKAMVGFSYKF